MTTIPSDQLKRLLAQRNIGFAKLKQQDIAQLRLKSFFQLFSQFLEIYSFGMSSLKHLQSKNKPEGALVENFDFENAQRLARIFQKLRAYGL